MNIDEIVQLVEFDKVNWIKIDVEGAEFDVLGGAEKTLSTNKEISVLVEVHTESTYKSVRELLEKHNFKVDFEERLYNNKKDSYHR